MSTVREWGATFWADEDAEQDELDVFAGLVRHLLLDEVTDAVILEETMQRRLPAPWEDGVEGFQFVGVLIKYTSASQDAA